MIAHLRQAPWIWLLVFAWLVSAIYLALAGQGSWLVFALLSVGYELLFAWLSVRITRPMPPEPGMPRPARWRIISQLALVLVVISITGLSATPARLPLWSGMVDELQAFGERLLPAELVGGPGNALANPVQYFLIPLIGLLLLGARLVELGFGRGHRAWRVSALWSALPVLTWLVVVPMGQLPPGVLLRRLVGNALQNGFFEEFLFRGALFTRIRLVANLQAALVIQAFLFGLWHLGPNTRLMEGDLLAGLAACIVNQTVTGLVYGILFTRTRNLLAPSVAHVMMNAFGQMFG